MILLAESRIMLSKSNRPPEPDECVRALSNLSWSKSKTFSSIVWSTHDAAGTPEMDESGTPPLIGGRAAPLAGCGMHRARPSSLASSCRRPRSKPWALAIAGHDHFEQNIPRGTIVPIAAYCAHNQRGSPCKAHGSCSSSRSPSCDAPHGSRGIVQALRANDGFPRFGDLQVSNKKWLSGSW